MSVFVGESATFWVGFKGTPKGKPYIISIDLILTHRSMWFRHVQMDIAVSQRWDARRFLWIRFPWEGTGRRLFIFQWTLWKWSLKVESTCPRGLDGTFGHENSILAIQSAPGLR